MTMCWLEETDNEMWELRQPAQARESTNYHITRFVTSRTTTMISLFASLLQNASNLHPLPPAAIGNEPLRELLAHARKPGHINDHNCSVQLVHLVDEQRTRPTANDLRSAETSISACWVDHQQCFRERSIHWRRRQFMPRWQNSDDSSTSRAAPKSCPPNAENPAFSSECSKFEMCTNNSLVGTECAAGDEIGRFELVTSGAGVLQNTRDAC